MVTVNQMILDTLKTKTDKEPKYKKVLESLGYEITKSRLSTQGYWQVNNLVISKDYNKKTALFSPYCFKCYFNSFKFFDFEDYFKKRKVRDASPWWEVEDTKIERYKELKSEMSRRSSSVENSRKAIKEYEKKIEKEEEYIKEQQEHITKANNEIVEMLISSRRNK